MNLKCYKKTVIEVDYTDFEDYVKSVYPSTTLSEHYDFVATEECSNDITLRFDVQYKRAITDKQRKRVLANLSSNYELIEMMVSDGLLEPAEYIIRVSWE